MQPVINNGSLSGAGGAVTVEAVANYIWDNWNNRGFPETPPTGKCPSRSQLAKVHIPKWKTAKNEPLIGLLTRKSRGGETPGKPR